MICAMIYQDYSAHLHRGEVGFLSYGVWGTGMVLLAVC